MTPANDSGSQRSLLDELRGRGVIGVAVVYAVVGWTLVEVADAVFPALALPDWSVTLVVALVLVGFPLAMVLAWAFERTPSGMRRAPAASRARMATATVLGVGVLGLLALALGAGRSGRPAADRPSSIAVLPFEDLSPGDQSYFSEGIAEELMSVLATVPELDVVGRATAFAIRERASDIREIGEELGVDVVLDGSVRREGDDLRISVQLIDATTGRVLWSERYDRRAGELFVLQDQIATAVAREVEVRLSLAPPAEADPARLRAHDLYLQGLAAWHRRTRQDNAQALRLFQRAVAADSTYAPAHAGIALALTVEPIFGDAPESWAEHAERTGQAARRALELDPGHAPAHAALSQRAMILTWDIETATDEARRAIELWPSYATGWQWYAETLWSQRRTEEALEAIDRAIELDPLAPAPQNIRGAILFTSGEVDEAIQLARTSAERFPGTFFFYDALLTMGLCSADSSLVLEGVAGLDPGPPRGQIELIVAAMRAPPGSEARHARVERLVEEVGAAGSMKIVMLAAALGETDLALRRLEDALEHGVDRSLLYILPMPCMAAIGNEPRYRELLDRVR